MSWGEMSWGDPLHRETLWEETSQIEMASSDATGEMLQSEMAMGNTMGRDIAEGDSRWRWQHHGWWGRIGEDTVVGYNGGSRDVVAMHFFIIFFSKTSLQKHNTTINKIMMPI